MDRRHDTLTVAISLALGLLARPTPAQPAVPSAGAARPASRATSLDVIVSDGSGNPVRGLEATDFELWLDGAPAAVTSLVSAREGAAAPSEAGGDRQLVLVTFVDSACLTPSACAGLLAKTEAALLGALRTSGVRTMVVSGGAKATIRLGLGNNPEALHRVLQTLGRECAAGPATASVATSRPIMTGGPPPAAGDRAPDGLDPARPGSAESQLARARTSLEGLTVFVRSLGGLPGRKALLYLGGAIVPGPEARSGGSTGVEIGERATGQAASTAPSELLRSLADQANASGVTFYYVEATGRDAAETAPPGPESLAAQRPTVPASALAVTAGLGQVAAATGGQATSDRPDLADALSHFFTDFQDYYRVGFALPSGGVGVSHQVRVDVTRPGTTVRTRSSFVDLTEDERMAGRALAALDLGVANNPLGIQVSATAEVNAKEGSQVVSVLVTIPLGKLAFEPGTVAQESDLVLWLAARDCDGRLTLSLSHRFPVSVPNDRFLAALSQSAAYTFRVPMKAGPGNLAVTVRDEIKEQDATAVATVGGTGQTTGEGTR